MLFNPSSTKVQLQGEFTQRSKDKKNYLKVPKNYKENLERKTACKSPTLVEKKKGKRS